MYKDLSNLQKQVFEQYWATPSIERVRQLIWVEDCRARVQLAGDICSRFERYLSSYIQACLYVLRDHMCWLLFM